MCVTFLIYKKPDTLRYAVFHGIFEIGGGWGGICYKQKTMHFALHFYMQKKKHFALRLYIKKGIHFASHFFMQKTVHFAVRFYI